MNNPRTARLQILTAFLAVIHLCLTNKKKLFLPPPEKTGQRPICSLYVLLKRTRESNEDQMKACSATLVAEPLFWGLPDSYLHDQELIRWSMYSSAISLSNIWGISRTSQCRTNLSCALTGSMSLSFSKSSI